MKYKASLDTPTKIITVSAVIILALVCFTTWKGIWPVNSTPRIGGIAAFILVVFVFIGCYLYSTSLYVLDDTGITIVRKWRDKKIKLKEIASVTAIDKGEMGLPIRTFGNGGFLWLLRKVL